MIVLERQQIITTFVDKLFGNGFLAPIASMVTMARAHLATPRVWDSRNFVRLLLSFNLPKTMPASLVKADTNESAIALHRDCHAVFCHQLLRFVSHFGIHYVRIIQQTALGLLRVNGSKKASERSSLGMPCLYVDTCVKLHLASQTFDIIPTFCPAYYGA